ncbi:MAG: hypothetical protein CME63_10210 [Halobacteriovoraceae bacterium]|nr:hypothetical protein [Halobacteriovoraceae bacterium]|tara:strand:+ start:2259 stop:3488 length:1230 start_codon:yes stop_codon:yes gene_type:complete
MGLQKVVDFLVVFASDFLMPVMVCTFAIGIIARVLIWWTIKREYWFSAEFEKRIQRYINSVEDTSDLSFFVITKKLLEITFYETFEVRSIMKRRNPDVVMNWMDRVFLVQQGCARVVNDVLRKVRYYRFDIETPKFVDLSKNVLQNNPCFNRIFGIIPMGGLNDFLNILPNLFIVGGIFGTFIGIMKALPELGGMDLSDVENSKMIMDTFLLKVSFSMSTSILGIVLSVSLTLLNTFFSAEKQFVSTIENFTESFNTLWSISSNNNLPKDKLHLEEDEDPLLVLAEDVVAKELNVKPGFVKLTRPIQGWWLQQRNPKESEGVSKDGTAKFRLNSDASHQPPQNEAPEKEEDTVPQSREDLLASKEVPELKKPVETEKPKEETAPTESVSHEHPELEADSEEETDKESAA